MRARLVAMFAVAVVGCSASSDDGTTSDSALGGWTPHKPADPTSCAGTPVAGRLTMYLIPPSTRLDWSLPKHLLTTAIKSELSEGSLEREGKVGLPHAIGHLNLELDCGAYSLPLTGQTGGDLAWKSATDGFGMLLRSFDGSMNAFPEQAPKVREDIRLREQNGLLSRVTFLVSEATCKRVKSFHDAYLAHASYERYGGQFRSRRFEGGGCAIWGADVIDVSGMLRRSVYTPEWTQSLLVGQARFSNVLGADHFASGSNLVWRGPDGKSLLWPARVDVPTRTAPILPTSRVLDAWTGPEDRSFGLPEGTLMRDRVLPFTIYDPMKMNDWAERVWAEAREHGSATSLEATWTASTVSAAHEITTDAHCTAPQTIPFERDNDDLFEDSDAP